VVPSPAPAVAIVDIGSNTIKVLVARRDEQGRLCALKLRTVDARISAGISDTTPRLKDEGMAAGLAAIQELLRDAASFNPTVVALVATSAVRDAVNGARFRERIQKDTGQTVRILTGDEEAQLIGRGLTCDPSLADLDDFYVFDLGGGSLECLSFAKRAIRGAVSLQLGCVRLTERCLSDAEQPFRPSDSLRVADVTRQVLGGSGFAFELSADATAVGTGGTFTTTRAILAARDGKTLDETSPVITTPQLQELLSYVGRFGLADRRQIPGLPAARADIFPTALATLIAIAEIGNFSSFRHSLYNLRWGLADELLPAKG
jgi:exopolyphosphatase/guanosine-5'-triphosphate,3'-diphosphate pyrophosphatase